MKACHKLHKLNKVAQALQRWLRECGGQALCWLTVDITNQWQHATRSVELRASVKGVYDRRFFMALMTVYTIITKNLMMWYFIIFVSKPPWGSWTMQTEDYLRTCFRRTYWGRHRHFGQENHWRSKLDIQFWPRNTWFKKVLNEKIQIESHADWNLWCQQGGPEGQIMNSAIIYNC